MIKWSNGKEPRKKSWVPYRERLGRQAVHEGSKKKGSRGPDPKYVGRRVRLLLLLREKKKDYGGKKKAASANTRPLEKETYVKGASAGVMALFLRERGDRPSFHQKGGTVNTTTTPPDNESQNRLKKKKRGTRLLVRGGARK